MRWSKSSRSNKIRWGDNIAIGKVWCRRFRPGIINIITKKNTLRGLTLNVDAGAGLRLEPWPERKLSQRQNGFHWAALAAGYMFAEVLTTNRSATHSMNWVLTLLLPSTCKMPAHCKRNLFGRYQFGWDYEINKKNNISASVRYGVRNGRNFQNDLKRLPQHSIKPVPRHRQPKRSSKLMCSIIPERWMLTLTTRTCSTNRSASWVFWLWSAETTAPIISPP